MPIMNELIQQEEKIIKRIFELKKRLASAKYREANQECELWINTDFAKLGLKNAEQRKSYVKKEQSKMIKTSDLYKDQLNLCEQLLTLIHTKQRALFELGYQDEYNFYDEMIEELFKEVGVDG